MMGVFVQVNLDSPFARTRPVGYVIQENGCWQWVSSTTTKGYGSIWRGGRFVRAHRSMYEAVRGPIPDGLMLDHLCRNPGCVNPDHLEPVTNRVNVLRGEGHTAKNARKTHCLRGHPLEGDNVRVINLGNGHSGRWCRTCLLIQRSNSTARRSLIRAKRREEGTR